MNPFVLIKDLYDASEVGKEIANPETWAKRAKATTTVTILVTVCLSLLKQLAGIDLGLSDAELQQIGAAVAVIGVSIAQVMSVASNPNAGKTKV